MYQSDVKKMAQAAAKKIEVLENSPASYLTLSAFAGAYLAFGIGLILFLGAPLAAGGSPLTKLVMGSCFGIALTLVIFAGSELFTGNNMFGVIGALGGYISWSKMLRLWLWCYFGNLLGSLFLAWLLVQSGLFSSAPQQDFVLKATALKMHIPLWPLFVRGILANWLVCLAVWCSARTQSEPAKLALIFWCLLAFVAPGFEHSIANMSTLAMGLLLPHDPAVINAYGYVRNLSVCTLGNIVGGGFFVGALYWFTSPVESEEAEESAPEAVAMAPAQLAPTL